MRKPAEASKQEGPAVDEARRLLAAKQEALEATNQELVSTKKLKADTWSELARLNAVLRDAERTWVSQDLEVKESDRQLRDVTAKASQRVTELQAKMASLPEEAAQLLASLNQSGGSSSA